MFRVGRGPEDTMPDASCGRAKNVPHEPRGNQGRATGSRKGGPEDRGHKARGGNRNKRFSAAQSRLPVRGCAGPCRRAQRAGGHGRAKLDCGAHRASRPGAIYRAAKPLPHFSSPCSWPSARPDRRNLRHRTTQERTLPFTPCRVGIHDPGTIAAAFRQGLRTLDAPSGFWNKTGEN